MALLEKYLFVKKSTLPNTGKGLFTKKAIPKDTRIVEYKGRRTTWKEVKDQAENGYIFYITAKKVIDAWPTTKALARYANDASGLTRVKGLTNNAIYVVDKDKAYIESTKDIAAGDEIFVKYGGDYWQVVRENIRKDKAKARRKEKARAKKVKNKTSVKKTSKK